MTPLLNKPIWIGFGIGYFGGPLILQKICLQCFVDLLEMGKLGEWMTVKTRRTPRLKGRLIIVSRQKGKGGRGGKGGGV